MHPDIIFVLLHGTFARRAGWVDSEAPLARTLSRQFGTNILFVSPRWSGANSNRARQEAAEALRSTLRALTTEHPTSPLFILAHSHGGNVALYAMQDRQLQSAVSGIACVATPFLIASVKPQSGLHLNPLHDPIEAAELAIATFPPERTLILTSPGDEAASFLMAGQFWRWIARRLDVGEGWAAWVLGHKAGIGIAGLLALSLPASRNLPILLAVGGAIVLTVISVVVSRIALFLSFGAGAFAMSKKLELLVAPSPPGKWSVIQIMPWPLDPEVGVLGHSLYEHPVAADLLITWIHELLASDRRTPESHDPEGPDPPQSLRRRPKGARYFA